MVNNPNKQIILKVIESNGCDAIFIFSKENMLWYANINFPNSYLLITKTDSYLFVKKDITPPSNILISNIIKYSEFSNIVDYIKNINIKRCLIEDNISLHDYQKIIKKFSFAKNIGINLQELRIIKRKDEIELIKYAANICKKILKNILNIIKIGISEEEISKNISQEIINNDCEITYKPRVSFGENTLEIFHIPLSSNELNDGELIKIEFACKYKGYNAEIARTFVMQKNEKYSTILDEFKKINYNALDNLYSGNVNGRSLEQIYTGEINESDTFSEFDYFGFGDGIGIELKELPKLKFNYIKRIYQGSVISTGTILICPKIGGFKNSDTVILLDDGIINLTNDEQINKKPEINIENINTNNDIQKINVKKNKNENRK